MKSRVSPLFGILLAAYCGIAQAVNIRGLIEFIGPFGAIPMNGAVVSLCNQGGCASFHTGGDGMYYLALPPGIYAIYVNGRWFGNLGIPNVPLFDIAPIRGN